MARVIGRVVLGLCAVVAIVGGGALVVMVAVYFGADQYLSELHDALDALFAGVIGLGVYVGGAFRAHLAARVAAGIGAALCGYIGSMIVGFLVSLTADPGGPRGNLADGATGFLWLLAGAFFLLRIAVRRWPVAQRRER